MDNQNFNKKTDSVKILLFAVVMAFFFVVGLAFFLRPTESQNEKRKLTEFPKFTVSGFLSGEWTSQVSLWYADTYPMREGMISANSSLESLYGVKGEQVVVGDAADDIPHTPTDQEIVFNPTDDGGGERVQGMYVNGDTAYQLYSFNQQNSDSYAALINKLASQVKGKANIYDMIVPLHYQIALSRETADKFGASDCEAAINYMYGAMSDDITTVDALSEMIAHNTEYLYYRADHHWTARGAYYAYVAFCNQTGKTPTPLSAYTETGHVEGFLGTLYTSDKNKNPAAMEQNPDYIESFVPIGTNYLDEYDATGKWVDYWAIVNPKATSYRACFISGDKPLIKIHNDKITDGSSIVVVKESFGNAFVPFLVDSYEYIYVIDYRHWSNNNNILSEFVIENNIDDVLFLNVLGNSTAWKNFEPFVKIIDPELLKQFE